MYTFNRFISLFSSFRFRGLVYDLVNLAGRQLIHILRPGTSAGGARLPVPGDGGRAKEASVGASRTVGGATGAAFSGHQHQRYDLSHLLHLEHAEALEEAVHQAPLLVGGRGGGPGERSRFPAHLADRPRPPLPGPAQV